MVSLQVGLSSHHPTIRQTTLVKVTATCVYCKQEKHAYTWQLKEEAVIFFFFLPNIQINESSSSLAGRGLGTTESILILSIRTQ